MNRLLLACLCLAACKSNKEAPPASPPAPSSTPDAAPKAAAPAPPDAVPPAVALTDWQLEGATHVDSLAELCKNQKHEGFSEGCSWKKPDQTLGGLSAPYKSVLLFWSGKPEEGMAEDKAFHLAIETDKGWFVHSFEKQGSGGLPSVEIDSIELADFFPGGNRKGIESYEEPKLSDLASEQKIITICGVGASGEPKCVADLQLSENAHDQNDDNKDKIAWEVKLTPTKDGFDLAAASGKPPKELVGAFRVVFP